MQCQFCEGFCVKRGFQKSGMQKYQCRLCNRYQQAKYKNLACEADADKKLIAFIKEGCGIRSIARLMHISPTTVIKKTLKIASTLKPLPIEQYKTYEVDEIRTFVGNKNNESWIAYAIERTTKLVVSIKIGRRTKMNLMDVLQPVLQATPKKIRTDGLNIYRYIIPEHLHTVREYFTNKIERMNLTLRTHLKRLCRKTICFSRCEAMLDAVVKIYCWS
jgi:insertion element IS1 protein InsB